MAYDFDSNTKAPALNETEAFELLARTDVHQWVRDFLASFDLETDDVASYQRFDEDNAYLGMWINLVHEEGGGEGDGETVERVFSVNKPGEIITYFEVDGHYESYNGTDWDGSIYEVKPVQVVVTQYHAL